MKSVFCFFAVALMGFPLMFANAQETTASGPLKNEASWSALQNLIDMNKSNITLLRTQMNAQIECAKKTMLWNGSACVPTQQKMQSYSYYGTGNWGGAGTVNAGWHTFCTLAFHHDRTNHWLNITAGPNAAGKFYWSATRAFPGDMNTSEPRILCVD